MDEVLAQQERRGFSFVLTGRVGATLASTLWFVALAFVPSLRLPAFAVFAICAVFSLWAEWGQQRHVESLISALSAVRPDLLQRHGRFRVLGAFYRLHVLEALVEESTGLADPAAAREAAWVRGAIRAWRIGRIVMLVAVIAVLAALIPVLVG